MTLTSLILIIHLLAVISWMAGLLYLPRLLVYHSENTDIGERTISLFQTMQRRLFHYIMTPAMIVSWGAGLSLYFLSGWHEQLSLWIIVKALSIFAMTFFHCFLGAEIKRVEQNDPLRPSRTYRFLNEVPTLLMILIVSAVVIKY